MNCAGTGLTAKRHDRFPRQFDALVGQLHLSHCCLLLAHADLGLFDNPQCPLELCRWQAPEESRPYFQNLVPRLASKPEHDDSRMLAGWISSNIRKVHVERENGATLTKALRRKSRVLDASDALIEDRHGVMSGETKNFRELDGKILVQFESHAVSLRRHRHDSFLRQIRGVADSGLDRFTTNGWVTLDYGFRIQASCKIVQNRSYEYTSTSHTCVSVADFGVDRNVISPVNHFSPLGLSPSPRTLVSPNAKLTRA